MAALISPPIVMPEHGSEAHCLILAWDTAFWGFTVARVAHGSIHCTTMRAIDAWCREHEVRCLYFLAAQVEPTPHHDPEAFGFRLVDIRRTLVRQIDSVALPTEVNRTGVTVRPATLADVPALRTIARHSHENTRFFNDPSFPREGCYALYETWIARSCEGYADIVLVAERGGTIIGYLSCHLGNPAPGETTRAGSIGLVGVNAAARGGGVGQGLIAMALQWFSTQTVSEIQVVTQGLNHAAIRLYERCGFQQASSQSWYHKWYQAGSIPPQED